MLTLNTIVEELKDVPVNRLEELYSIIQSFKASPKKNGQKSEDILSFAGAFEDIPEKEYTGLVQHTKDTRNELFNRGLL